MIRSKFPFFLLLLVVILASCQSTKEERVKPRAVSGVIDLNDWRLSVDGELKLDGEWLFFWERLLDIEDLNQSDPPQPTAIYPFPQTWNKFILNGEELNGIGYASFVLKLKLHPDDVGRPLAVSLGDMDSSFRLSVNGLMIGKNGVVGTNKENSEPKTMARLLRFTPTQPDNTFILQISNFDYLKGGPWSSLILGDDVNLSKSHKRQDFLNTLMNGSILIMAIYHLVLAGLRKEDKSPLYFGVFCFLIALRSLITGDRYLLEVFPMMGFEVGISIEFLSFYLAVPAFFAYLHSLYPREIGKIPRRMVLIIGGAFSLSVLLTPAIVFGRTLTYYQLFTLLVGIYILYAIAMAFIRKREGVWVISIGFLVLFGSAVNDILHANEIIHTSYLISFGFVTFILSQAYLLSVRFANSFKTVEIQKNELATTNEALVKEIKANEDLTISLKESHQRFQDSRIALILGLAKLAEYRDEDTGLHLERMREYTRMLAQELSKMDVFKGYITEEYVQDIYQSAILHDIGKVGIKDSVLLKPGKLTDEEFDIIKGHPVIGGDAIKQVESKIQIRSFLTLGRDIAYFHHEKWDGSGYPFRLKQEEIPLSARIVALADVYDALTSERPYKEPFSHEKATDIIISSSGTHFDPTVVKAFQQCLSTIDKVRVTLQE